MPLSKKRLVGLTIVAFWLVMMGWMAKRQLLRSAAPGSVLVEETDSWLAVDLADGTPAGFVHLRRLPERREDRPGARWVVTSRLELRVLGRATELDLGVSAWQPIDGPFAELEIRLRSGEHDLHFEGGIEAGALNGVLTSAGEQIPLRFPVGDELLLGGGVGSALTLPLLEVGEEVVVDAFDTTSFSIGKARLRCVGEEELTIGGESMTARVLSIEASGLDSRAWVGSDGSVLRAETPFGLVLRRISAEEAMRLALGGGKEGQESAGDLVETSAIHLKGELPERGAARLRIRLGGVDDLSIPVTEDQRSLGDMEWEILGPKDDPVGGRQLASAERRSGLASDPFIQSDHPKIRSQAEKIVGDETDPWLQAVRIHEWIYEEIRKEVVLSVPSALDVLDTREGDCNEHTVLFTALSRAVGIPTKIAIGLVWSPELGGFYYHAWPVVWVGDWIKMDPTLGQVRADATHLALLEGGIESWPQLLPYLGRLKLEVIEIE